MQVLVFRCAQGSVIYAITRRPTFNGVTATCLNDGKSSRIAIPPFANAAVGFDALAAKAVTLKGAIAQIAEVSL
jgi:hypothetical protein